MMLAEPRPTRTRVFEYNSLPASSNAETSGDNRRGTGGESNFDFEVKQESSHLEKRPNADRQLEIDRLTEELQAQEMSHAVQMEEVRSQAIEAGHAAAKREAEQSVQERLDRLSSLMKALDIETRTYLVQVEREVITLALDIACRIMKHEAQIDPLFLTGAVRVALEAMQEGSEILVRVPEKDAAAWKESLQETHFGKRKVTFDSDPRMSAGECICKLSTGTLDIGVRAQIAEVERTFGNLLRRREAERPRAPAEAGEPPANRPMDVPLEEKQPIG